MKKEKQNPVPQDSKLIQGRNFTYIAYPDSMPSNLFDILRKDSDDSQKQTNSYSILISPIHDRDIDELGKLKKPHYHIIVMHDSEITLPGARRWGELRGLVMCEKCGKKALARYLCHLDQKDKVLYNTEDVIAFNCNYLDIIGNSFDKFDCYRSIMAYIKQNNILFYCDLLDYCEKDNDDWFRFLCSGGTFTIDKYLKDRRAQLLFNQSL